MGLSIEEADKKRLETIKAENRVSFHENNEDDIAIYNMDNEQNKNKKSSISIM